MSGSRCRIASVVSILALAACGSSAESTTSDSSSADASVTAPAGTTMIVGGLVGPTQIADGPDGMLLVAQINGDENASSGQVLEVDTGSGSRQVLLDHLDKPTGVAWLDGSLWVMVRRSLLRVDWDGGSPPLGSPEVVLDDLPYNGRSEGTLTPLGDHLLYETTGSLAAGEVVAGSGTLWDFDPTDRTSRAVATNVKNAYAHAVLDDGRLLTTDIGDNIADAPVEELDVISAGGTSDLGWPSCPGDQDCDGVVSPIATFDRSSTPTGVAVFGGQAYVALFVTGRLVRVGLDGAHRQTPTTLLDGLAGPHTVLARSDGSLWISENVAGDVIAYTP